MFRYRKVRKAFNPAIMEPVFSVQVLDAVDTVLYQSPDQDNFTASEADDFGVEVVAYLEGLGTKAFVQEADYAKTLQSA